MLAPGRHDGWFVAAAEVLAGAYRRAAPDSALIFRCGRAFLAHLAYPAH